MPEYIVHDHYDGQNSYGNSNAIIGIILFALVLFLLFFYGLPVIRSSVSPQINVPSKIDVNLNQK